MPLVPLIPLIPLVPLVEFVPFVAAAAETTGVHALSPVPLAEVSLAKQFPPTSVTVGAKVQPAPPYRKFTSSTSPSRSLHGASS